MKIKAGGVVGNVDVSSLCTSDTKINENKNTYWYLFKLITRLKNKCVNSLCVVSS
jgi:hypothetical protein